MRAARGAAACAWLALLGLLGQLLWTVTGGLQHWTFESLRRAQAGRGELRAAALPLVDAAGQAFLPWRTAGADDGPDVLIVDFVYTRCPSVCQALGSTYERLQSALQRDGDGGAAADHRIGLLSISFDTAHDDPGALAAYGRLHHARPETWRIAVPQDEADAQRLLRSLGVVVVPDGRGGYTHNAALHLVDRDGRLRAIHDHADWTQALDHARRLGRNAP